MKYSILIPTKNRSKYAIQAIKSALDCNHINFEVIVQDCSDNDELKNEIDHSHRNLKYFRSPTGSSMTENWNNAIINSDGDYVTIIGDDDAIISDALLWADFYLRQEKVDIINGISATYQWPDCGFIPWRNMLAFHTGMNFKIQHDCKSVLQRALRYQPGIGTGPGIYRNFISRSLLKRIHQKRGAYILDAIPDFDSGHIGLALANGMIKSDRTLFVSGHSSVSNSGRMRFTKAQQKSLEEFAGDLGKNTSELSALEGINFNSTAAVIVSAQLRMLDELRQLSGVTDLSINLEAAWDAICYDFRSRHTDINFKDELVQLRILAERWGIDRGRHPIDMKPTVWLADSQGVRPSENISESYLVRIDGNQAGLNNVYDAAKLISGSLPTIEISKRSDLIGQFYEGRRDAIHYELEQLGALKAQGKMEELREELMRVLRTHPKEPVVYRMLYETLTYLNQDELAEMTLASGARVCDASELRALYIKSYQTEKQNEL